MEDKMNGLQSVWNMLKEDLISFGNAAFADEK
jgi:hypothetical protein